MSEYIPVNNDLYDACIEVGSHNVKFSGLGQTEIMRLLSLMRYATVELNYEAPKPPEFKFTPHVVKESNYGN